MALTWDLTRIADHDTLCWKADPEGDGVRLNGVTECLIWYTMTIGIGDLSAANADEFYTRMRMYDEVAGPLCVSSKGPVALKYEDVLAHVGLRTNVFPKWSVAKFNEHLGRILRQSAHAELIDQKRAMVGSTSAKANAVDEATQAYGRETRARKRT